MLTDTPAHDLREDVDVLLMRLAGIDSRRVTLAAVHSLHERATGRREPHLHPQH